MDERDIAYRISWCENGTIREEFCQEVEEIVCIVKAYRLKSRLVEKVCFWTGEPIS